MSEAVEFDGGGQGLAPLRSVGQFEDVPAVDPSVVDEAYRWQRLGHQVDKYNPTLPEASHLRTHQIKAIDMFRKGVQELMRGTMTGGMAILHPTGSGKTVTITEAVRIVCESDDKTDRIKALVLVPGHQILGQTVGNEDELGAVRTFAPNLSVREYSGRRKSIAADVTVMNYQALPGAVARGDIDTLNPDLIVCDEVHHVIDGVWANAVEKISEGRVLLGATATPAYSERRNVARLFPNTLDKKTMKEGIEEGTLASLKGFVYKGKSRIRLTRNSGDFADEDLFNAIANSEDNYLAAKVCAQEVAQGRRGVVSCVPGSDRAHAKVMAEILSQTKVVTESGERTIRAAFVGGEMNPDALQRIFNDYKAGRLDVLTYVNLLLEGWDSPETDFTVLLRPTRSRLLAEQRLGRTIRPRDGKVATVHEVVYEVDGPGAPQFTHIDLMDERVVRQGFQYGPNKEREYEPRKPSSRSFSAKDFTLDPDISKRIAELEALPLEELMIMCGQDAVPITWLTSRILGTWFDIEAEAVEAALAGSSVPFRTETTDDVSRTFYPRRAAKFLAEKLGYQEIPEGYVTASDIYMHHRDYGSNLSSLSRPNLSRSAIAGALAEQGIVPQIFITSDGQRIEAYPPESLDVHPAHYIERYVIREQPQIIEPELVDVDLDNVISTYAWLIRILVNPSFSRFSEERQRVIDGQNTLITMIGSKQEVSAEDVETLQAEIAKEKLNPSEQMKNVMSAKKLTFEQLMNAASEARKSIAKTEQIRNAAKHGLSRVTRVGQRRA